MDTARQREALRQQALVQALWHVDAEDTPAIDGWLRGKVSAGLDAYRRNAAALAERALAAAYPTVAALVGDACFAGLARALWHHHPPTCGDLAEWGHALPGFIAGQAPLASEPYLADSAALDLAVHRAALAADAATAPLALERMALHEPSHVRLPLTPGAALIDSAWPVVELWQAHQPGREAVPDRFDAARAALAAGQGQCAFVHREGLAVRVTALDSADAAFTAALLRGEPLAAALDAAGEGWAFDRWLIRALQGGWLEAVLVVAPSPDQAPT